MPASEDVLGSLHTKVCHVLSKALDGRLLPEVIDEDTGDVIQEAVTMEPSAAMVTASIQFLKNNNITCAPAEDNAIGELTAKMQKRNADRANRAKGNVVDFEAAREQATFVGDKLGHG